jgi:uncharacterized delta-60 repeat protein
MQPSKPRSRPTAAPRLRLEHLEPRETPALVGGIDQSFGTHGAATLGGVNGNFIAAVVQPDDKIVTAGFSVAGTSASTLVARFTPTGTPDPAFGTNGTVGIPGSVSGTPGGATAVAVQADGKIVVALAGDGQNPVFDLLRLNPDGSPDTTFGPNGVHFYPFVQPGNFEQVVIEPDGSIVAAGDFGAPGHEQFLVVRFKPANGNQTGADQIINFGSPALVTGIALQPDGHVIVAGRTESLAPDYVVTRLPADLSSFQTFTRDLGGMDIAAGVVTDPVTGAIIVGGNSDQVAGPASLAVIRVKPDLSGLDPTFNPNGAGTGTPGVAKFDTGAAFTVKAVVGQPDGRVVLAGVGEAGTTFTLNAIRVNVDGSLDASFAATSGATLTVPGAVAFGAALDNSGRIVTAGHVPGAGTATTPAVFPIVGRIGNPVALSVGGAVSANANVYVPSGGAYTNPATTTTPANVFPGYTGEVRVATADVNGDGVPDTIEVTGPGAPTRMAVVDGNTHKVIVPATDPFGDANFSAGAYVTAGDISGTGRADWAVTPALTGGPRVVIFQLLANGTFDITSAGQPSLVANFFGIGDPGFRDGDRVALGDVNGDGILDVFSIAAFNGGPRTALYNGADVLVARAAGRDPMKLVGDFFAAPSGQDEGRGGRSIAVGDVNGDGVADLIATGDNTLGTGNQVVIFSGADLIAGRFPGFGATPLANFTVGGQDPAALVSVAAVNADGDARADLAVGSGAGQESQVKVYLGKNLAGSAEPASTSLDPFGTTTVNGVFVG